MIAKILKFAIFDQKSTKIKNGNEFEITKIIFAGNQL